MRSVITLRDYFTPIECTLLPIVGEKSWAALLLAAQDLPGLDAGFELRLGEFNRPVDFFIRATGQDGGQWILGGQSWSNRVNPHLGSSVAWQRIAEFCNRWAQGSLPTPNIRSFWAEFDYSDGAFQLRTPSVFFGLTDNFSHYTPVDLIETLGVLVGPDFVRYDNGFVQDCLGHLSSVARPYQFGAMQSRYPSPLRICIENWTEHSLKQFLLKFSYAGEVSVLVDAWRTLSEISGTVSIAIDLQPGIANRVGLECYPESACKSDVWNRLLRFLCDRNLIHPIYLPLVLAWPGQTSRDLAFIQSRFGGGRSLILRRILSHLKLIFDGASLTESKLYFGFERAWQ